MKKSSLVARFGLIIVCACCFMTALDLTVVNVAIPVMTNTLRAPLSQITWVVNGYLLVYAALAIPAGRLADTLGQRRLFLMGLVLFTLASALCGFATNAMVLIGARLLQGVGSACITAPSLVLLTAVVPAERRGAALGIYASMIALARVVGPVAGGFIVSTLGTNWIFFINVPIGVALVAGTLVVVPSVKLEKPHSFDSGGVVLAALGLSSIIFAIVEGPTYNWGAIVGSLTVMQILIGGVVMLVIFAFWERFQREPFLPLSFFRNWPFACMVTINVVISFAALAVNFVLTLYLESALGMSALLAGTILLPQALAVLIGSPLAGRLYDKLGGIPVLAVGLLGYALGIGLLAWFSTPTTSWPILMIPLVIAGAGVACTMSPIMGEALRAVKPAMMGAASGVISMTRLVGGAIGVAVTSSLLQSNLFAEFNTRMTVAVQQVPVDQQATFTAYMHALMQSTTIGHTSLSLSLQRLGQQIYTESFSTALRPTLLLVMSLLIFGIVLASSVRVQRSLAVKKAAKEAALAVEVVGEEPQPTQSVR